MQRSRPKPTNKSKVLARLSEVACILVLGRLLDPRNAHPAARTRVHSSLPPRTAEAMEIEKMKQILYERNTRRYQVIHLCAAGSPRHSVFSTCAL